MDALDTFGEPPVTVDPPERRDNILDDPRATIDDVAGEVSDDGDTDEDPPLDDEDKTASSPVDAFGLDSERFKEEQRRTPWIQALIAFLESGALALDAQLRVKVLQLAPRYVVRNDTRRLVERQLLKAQDRNARRRADQVAVQFREGDAVLKKFTGCWSRPFPNEVPSGVERQPDADDAGPLSMDDLSTTSFIERLTLGGEETAFSGASSPIVEVLAKRIRRRQEQYLVLTASYETCWCPTSTLLPEYAELIRVYESERRKEGG
ncbi:hypothetical protein PR003_g22351 [Phytophthora rubi]|uniref:Uncharacterized protein n=1 Tax=Phytophthora rubi TaxID=129364 RepID=A0A6A4D5J2_9STRA|nr:hypothetical protein PR003_g22351 [Phytophthora rubi]